jgi:hypothetical protein
MSKFCSVCGYTKSQAVADARTLGLQKELESGVNTCCQIAEWADEQRLAWLEAAQEDSKRLDDLVGWNDVDSDHLLVPVRLRRGPRPVDPSLTRAQRTRAARPVR